MAAGTAVAMCVECGVLVEGVTQQEAAKAANKHQKPGHSTVTSWRG